MKIVMIALFALLLSACAEAVTPTPESSANQFDMGAPQFVDGVTIAVDALQIALHSADALDEIDDQYSHLFDDAEYVGMVAVTVTNETGEPVSVYPATFGTVMIDGKSINLASFQFFGDSSEVDPLLAGSSYSASFYFPSPAVSDSSQITYTITGGLEPVFKFAN